MKDNYIDIFINKYILPKISTITLSELHIQKNREQLVEVITEAFIDLNIELDDSMIDQMSHNIINYSKLHELKKKQKKYKYEPAEVDLLQKSEEEPEEFSDDKLDELDSKLNKE